MMGQTLLKAAESCFLMQAFRHRTHVGVQEDYRVGIRHVAVEESLSRDAEGHERLAYIVAQVLRPVCQGRLKWCRRPYKTTNDNALIVAHCLAVAQAKTRVTPPTRNALFQLHRAGDRFVWSSRAA